MVRSVADWNARWKAHGGAAAAPDVDFARDMIVAVFLGTRPTGGFSVEIVGARREEDALVIQYVEQRPDPAAIVTQRLH